MAKTNKAIVIENEGTQPAPAAAPAATDQVPKVPEKASAGLVRFWSMKERHQVALPSGRNVVFKDHVFLAEDSGPIAKAIRAARIHDIREIIDTPFESESDQAKFNKFLNDMVYTGERGLASRRGVKLLEGLFSRDEYSKLQDDHYRKTKNPLTLDVIIMRALRTKAFKGGI
jgi:hypothetical protein